jgi:hypothetical protein
MKDTLISIFIVSKMASICKICRFLTNNIPAPVVYKGNNKITELLTILQRESQNS